VLIERVAVAVEEVVPRAALVAAVAAVQVAAQVAALAAALAAALVVALVAVVVVVVAAAVVAAFVAAAVAAAAAAAEGKLGLLALAVMLPQVHHQLRSACGAHNQFHRFLLVRKESGRPASQSHVPRMRTLKVHYHPERGSSAQEKQP